MTRFINAVLISVFAFFVFLGVFWQFAGGGTGAGPRGEPAVVNITPRWQPGVEQELLVELAVLNPGSEGKVTSVSYEALVDGQVVDRALARVPPGPAITIPTNEQGAVRFPVDLPDGFAVTWWPDYMEDAEDSDLSIQGTVGLRRGDGEHEAPFEWRSSWKGELAQHLTDAAANCDPDPQDLCLQESRFFWEDGALHATLTLHNPGPDPVAVRNATLKLNFGEHAVVSGKVDLVREVRPGDDAEVQLALSFSQTAIAAWWPDHIARCERTPLSLGMDLQAQSLPDPDEPSQVTTLQWTFPASTFSTRFVCAQ